ncbi:ABC transporter permease [Streptomyces sp. 4N509B]|uniref:ABC transporter permease n=1 Tax=Streptomyces sp. 4N509B TaxID=3457413 RepID=UPI003FD643E1
MTAPSTALPAHPPRARRAVTDALTMTRRGLLHTRRAPGVLAVGLVFPVMMLVVFVYFLGGGMAVDGGGDYRDFLVPGLLTLTMVFGLEATMVEITSDLNKGILDRFRAMPIAPSAVLVGRSLLDMAHSAVSLCVMVGAGLAIGWRWHGTPVEALAAVGLLLWLRLAMLWAGIWLGLVAGRAEMVQAVQILVWPVAFLSNAFTSPDTMPGWLGAVAEWNPISATAAAVRELFGNPGWSAGGSPAADHPVVLALAWPVALLALCVPLALRRYAALRR